MSLFPYWCHNFGQSRTVAMEYDMERVVALDRLRLEGSHGSF
jgi:hypothetical protein